MYFTDDSLLPENQAPLMITAAPYGPMWMPGDCTPEQQLPVTWAEQTQIAVDCYNAGATILHIHVRDPKTGHISKNLREYGEQVARLRKAVPKMILQVGGSISFAPEPGEEAKFQSYDSRHKLAEIDPKPDQVTILCGTSLYDLTALHPVDDSFQGTRFENPAMLHAMANMVADSTPDFYLENLNVDGTICAIDDTCPHAGGALGMGKLDGTIVTCPVHGMKFDVTTGCFAGTSEFGIASYPVKVVDGKVLAAVL